MRLHFVILFAGITSSGLYGQSVSNTDQKKIDFINNWVSQQVKNGHVPTQTQMDSINGVAHQLFPDAPSQNSSELAGSIQKDSLLTIKVFAGASLTVPANKMWKVKRVFVSTGTGQYNILVTSIKFEKEFTPEEKLTAPGWCSEGSLLSEDASNLTFIFEIEERSVK